MRRLRPLLPLLLLPALSACGDARTPVVVYSPHGRDLLQALEKAYEAKHPEIDVRWLDMGSQEVYDRVRSEAANPQADLWFGGPDAIFGRGAKEGLLQPSHPSWAKETPPEGHGPGGLFYGAYRTLPILVYNSAAVPDAAAPADWDDLLDPRWKGKVLVRDPLASGTMRTLFSMELARSIAETGSTARGFAWLRRFDGQTKEYVSNPALLFQKLLRQEGLVTVWELSDILLQQQRGVQVAFRLAKSGTPVINDAVGLVAGAPHAEAARGFLEFIGSPEGQLLAARAAFKLPARTDLRPADLPGWAQKVLADLKPLPLDWALIQSHEASWMAEWDRSVRGHGAP